MKKNQNTMKELGIDDAEVPKLVADCVPAVKFDNYNYTSGQIPFVKGQLKYNGKIGQKIDEK